DIITREKKASEKSAQFAIRYGRSCDGAQLFDHRVPAIDRQQPLIVVADVDTRAPLHLAFERSLFSQDRSQQRCFARSVAADYAQAFSPSQGKGKISGERSRGEPNRQSVQNQHLIACPHRRFEFEVSGIEIVYVLEPLDPLEKISARFCLFRL